MVGGDFNWAAVVSVIVGIVGWIFVYHNSRSLARQSEANAIVAAIEKMLQEIVSDVSDFGGDAKTIIQIWLHGYLRVLLI